MVASVYCYSVMDEASLSRLRPTAAALLCPATRDAFKEAAELAETLGAAVFQSSIPYSAQFPSEHPAFMGALNRIQKQVRDTLAPYCMLYSSGRLCV